MNTFIMAKSVDRSGNMTEVKCACGINPFIACLSGCAISNASGVSRQTLRGCICPPGANKFCDSESCPRKPYKESHVDK